MDALISPAILLALVFGWFLWRSFRRKQPTTRVSLTFGQGRGRPSGDKAPLHRTSKPPPAGTWLARWHVHYRAIDGAITERVVQVISVHPRLEQFQVWCELRNDERALHFVGIQKVTDAETGAPINMDDWLDAYKASRRTRKP
jgi:hypothetical protein